MHTLHYLIIPPNSDMLNRSARLEIKLCRVQNMLALWANLRKEALALKLFTIKRIAHMYYVYYNSGDFLLAIRVSVVTKPLALIPAGS